MADFLVAGLILVFAITFVIVRYRVADKAPRKQRKLAWMPLAYVFLLNLYFYFHNPNNLHLFAALAMGGLLFYWWLIERDKAPSLAEARRNYEADQTRCGRCDYDLTGNTMGVCPECGWKIPAPDSPLQDRYWAAWFLKWRIDYLEDWRATYHLCLFITLMSAVIVLGVMIHFIWVGFSGYTPAGIAAILFVIHFTINAYRVRAYGRRVENEASG